VRQTKKYSLIDKKREKQIPTMLFKTLMSHIKNSPRAARGKKERRIRKLLQERMIGRKRNQA
jgi:hypothetical protein